MLLFALIHVFFLHEYIILYDVHAFEGERILVYLYIKNCMYILMSCVSVICASVDKELLSPTLEAWRDSPSTALEELNDLVEIENGDELRSEQSSPSGSMPGRLAGQTPWADTCWWPTSG